MRVKYSISDTEGLILVQDILGTGLAEVDAKFSELDDWRLQGLAALCDAPPAKVTERMDVHVLDNSSGRIYEKNGTYIVQKKCKDGGVEVIKTLEVKKSDLPELLIPADSRYIKTAQQYSKLKDNVDENSAKVYQAMAKIEGLDLKYQNMSLEEIQESLDGQFSSGVVYDAARSLLECHGVEKQAKATWAKNHKKRQKEYTRDALYSLVDKAPSYVEIKKIQNLTKPIQEKKYINDSNRKKTIPLPNIDYSQFMPK